MWRLSCAEARPGFGSSLPHPAVLNCKLATCKRATCHDLGRGAPHFHSASALTLLTLETRWNSPVPVPAGTGCVWCSWKHQDPAWRAKGKQNQGCGQTEERGIMSSSILRAGREEETTPRCKRTGSRKLAFGRKGGTDLLVQVGGREPINPSRQNLRTKPRKPGQGGRSMRGQVAGGRGSSKQALATIFSFTWNGSTLSPASSCLSGLSVVRALPRGSSRL